ncbi:MAG: hypothetical protein V1769_00060, partial [Thermoplasmatota archaeon]
ILLKRLYVVVSMTYGLDGKQEKKNTGLMEDKDYITEVYLQGGKVIGEIVHNTKRKKKKS